MISKRLSRSGKVRVTFALPAALWADSITLVGDFNGWDKQATPMRQTERGWVATVELEPGQAYEYRYLLNGSEWHNDWNADRYAPNQHGGHNSVVETPEFDPYEIIQEERVLNFAPRARLVPTG